MGNINSFHVSLVDLGKLFLSIWINTFRGSNPQILQQKICQCTQNPLCQASFSKSPPQPRIQQGQNSQQIIQQKNTTFQLYQKQKSRSNTYYTVLSILTLYNTSHINMLFPFKQDQLPMIIDKDTQSKDSQSDCSSLSDLSNLEVYDSDNQDTLSKCSKISQNKDDFSEESLPINQICLTNKDEDKDQNSPTQRRQTNNVQEVNKCQKDKELQQKIDSIRLKMEILKSKDHLY